MNNHTVAQSGDDYVFWRPYIPVLSKYEQQFDVEGSVQATLQYWPYTVPISTLYLIAVYAGAQWMKNRPPYSLRKELAIWSAVLCIFSLIGALNVVPEALLSLKRGGIFGATCENSRLATDTTIQFWSYVFCWSKLFEFGDTAFIVLRKQKITFLHTIHHALTFIFTFFAYKDHSSMLRLPTAMNYSIHFIMYGYYALRASGYRFPKSVQICITVSQILQMVIGAYAIGLSLNWHLSSDKQGLTCSNTFESSVSGVFLYCLYFVLFANFFVQTYINSGKGRKPVKPEVIKKQQ